MGTPIKFAHRGHKARKLMGVPISVLYNTQRYHESLNNLAPEDVYTGRAQTVLNRRMIIKHKPIAERRRLYNKQNAA